MDKLIYCSDNGCCHLNYECLWPNYKDKSYDCQICGKGVISFFDIDNNDNEFVQKYYKNLLYSLCSVIGRIEF